MGAGRTAVLGGGYGGVKMPLFVGWDSPTGLEVEARLGPERQGQGMVQTSSRMIIMPY